MPDKKRNEWMAGVKEIVRSGNCPQVYTTMAALARIPIFEWANREENLSKLSALHEAVYGLALTGIDTVNDPIIADLYAASHARD